MSPPPTDRPNILFILSDDQGPWALGCAGNNEIITPNLDRLAATGMRFENFFCASPVCSPARASLFTGKIPSQHGVHDWIRDGNDGPDSIGYLDGHTCYSDTLAGNGYTCGISGKWHLGASQIPRKSFDHWYVHQKGSGHYYKAPMYRDGNFEQSPDYISDLITDDAIEFMKGSSTGDRPFYCSVHFTAPHSPWEPHEHPQEIRAIYEDCPFTSCPQEPYHPLATYKFSPEDARTCLVGYFSAVTAMDRNIGRLLDFLDARGLRENTFVFFVSDNGFNCGHHGIWGKGNGTLIQNMYDTSVKVPAIASHPGKISEGTVIEDLVSGYDFLPTLLDYVGISSEYTDELPGVSFADRLAGNNTSGRDDVVVFDEYGPVRMIRTREWKYIHRYPYGEHELYDLSADPDERSNLIDDPERAKVIADLKSRMDSWFCRYVDPNFDGVREPVKGAGQIRLSGTSALGYPAFITERSVSTDPTYDPGMKKGD